MPINPAISHIPNPPAVADGIFTILVNVELFTDIMPEMTKPNFFIVGAAKAGTTSLHYYLSKHPDVYMSPIKEPNYFSKDIKVEDFSGYKRKKFSSVGVTFDKNNKILGRHQAYITDEKEYLKLFAAVRNEKIVGEASVSYLFSDVAAREIHGFQPNAKILIILRNPIERAFSHYLMDLRLGETISDCFIKAIEADYYQTNKSWGKTNLYIELGLYYQQVKRYYELFDKKNILLLKHQEFADNNGETINKICHFLDIDRDKLSVQVDKKNTAALPRNNFIKHLNKQSVFMLYVRGIIPMRIKKYLKHNLYSKNNLPKITNSDRIFLAQYFNEDAKLLGELTGLDFSEWIESEKYL